MLLTIRRILSKIQFPDDTLDQCIVIPFCREDGPFRPISHMNAYLAAINLHQHIRALGADHGQITKLFHCCFIFLLSRRMEPNHKGPAQIGYHIIFSYMNRAKIFVKLTLRTLLNIPAGLAKVLPEQAQDTQAFF